MARKEHIKTIQQKLNEQSETISDLRRTIECFKDLKL